jgi:hypothetical protein
VKLKDFKKPEKVGGEEAQKWSKAELNWKLNGLPNVRR